LSVSGLSGLKRQVITENDEALGLPLNSIGQCGQVGEVITIHFDQAKSLCSKLGQARTHKGRLACASRTGHEDIVGGKARDKMAGVANDSLGLMLDVVKIGKANPSRLGHCTKGSLLTKRGGLPPPLEGPLRRKVGCRGWLRQERVELAQQPLHQFRIDSRH
jgi:hypothetical protein